jgi:endonuclease YncB( thermonuclease family)
VEAQTGAVCAQANQIGGSVIMKLGKRSLIIVVVALAAALALIGTVSAGGPATRTSGAGPAVAAAVTPIPWAAETVLPEYIGAPAKARPLPVAHVPQDPFLAPNPFSYVHNDAWASDVYDIAGPLGHDPVVLSTTLAEARRNPGSPVFGCSGDVFDSHGRLILSCTGPREWSLVMVDPVTLEVLTYMYLPFPADQASSWSTAYLYLDNNDRVVMPVVDGDTVKIMVVQTVESAGELQFDVVREYDISSYIGPDDNINGLLADWQGRIWFVVRAAATVGVLDPATGSIKTLKLEGSITNGFSMDRDAAYIDTTAKMYRVEAGPDGAPRKVWEEGYENVGFKKPGQLSAGSGTTPTILGNGKYVAITDNAKQLHVVVYRTDKRLDPGEKRIVCEVPVFKEGFGADENSLIGSGLSLVAYNAYGNDFEKLFVPPLQPQRNEPGVARVDIDPNGRGCTKVWENDSITVTDETHKLSTKTGLIYAIGRKWDPTFKYPNGDDLDVYYFTAIDFRTGDVVWEKLLGTGFNFDGFENVLVGPTGTAYISQYGGLISIKDSN